MQTPTAGHLVAELRKRIETGDLTFDKDELARVTAMLEKLETRCAEAYQVVGSLAADLGLGDDPAVVRALDLLNEPHLDGSILPFVTARDFERGGAQPEAHPVSTDTSDLRTAHRRDK
jgi:hypothetical protein